MLKLILTLLVQILKLSPKKKKNRMKKDFFYFKMFAYFY